MERAAIIASGAVLQIDESMLRSDGAAADSTVDTLENVERNHIMRALGETNWVISWFMNKSTRALTRIHLPAAP